MLKKLQINVLHNLLILYYTTRILKAFSRWPQYWLKDLMTSHLKSNSVVSSRSCYTTLETNKRYFPYRQSNGTAEIKFRTAQTS